MFVKTLRTEATPQELECSNPLPNRYVNPWLAAPQSEFKHRGRTQAIPNIPNR